jgi:hypothetical protein
MIDTPSPLWWLALIQFIICGLFTLLVLVLPKFHHVSSSDRPYFLGIAAVTGMLALFGLAFMAAG